MNMLANTYYMSTTEDLSEPDDCPPVYRCSQCGEECDTREQLVLFPTTGPLTFAGEPLAERGIALVSDCCRADVLNEIGETVEFTG